MKDPEPTIYTSFLAVMCFVLMIFVLVQLITSLQNRNKLMSWSICFYTLCLLWTIVRITYWLMIMTRRSMTYLELYLLYWFPTPIQFANFSLLILFYIQVITGNKWRTYWRNICIPLYFLMTMSMATFTAVWAFNSSNEISIAYMYGDEYDQEFYKVSDVKVQLEYSSISFFLLSFLFGVFGWKMAKVERWKRKRMLISRPRALAAINFFLFLIFFTRATRDLATSQSWFLSIWNQLDLNGRVTTFAYFVFFCLWEFIPTIVLLMLITTVAGGVGAPRSAAFVGQGSKLPDFGIFHVINSNKQNVKFSHPLASLNMQEKSIDYGTSASQTPPIKVMEPPRWTHGGDLFEDPLRYDSDDGGASASSLHGHALNSLNSDHGSLGAASLDHQSYSYERTTSSLYAQSQSTYTPL